jgi:beta-glucosidase/6-phospho-beta-glucosidase/beta-galactosidase
MKTLKIFLGLIFILFVFITCSKDDVDDEKPEIDLTASDAFPVNCDTLYFGETFTFTALFTDNVELGSYSIDIHNNFNHHSHTTEVTECNLDDIKDPVNPYVSIEDYDIPEGLDAYETSLEITIPDGDSNGEFDEGDYHFFISLVDKEGWSVQKGLSIKILKRNK